MTSFDEVLHELDGLARRIGDRADALVPALAHCAQSIEYSMSGYPALRSALFRAVVGRLAKRQFLRRGAMSHDTSAPLPGAPPAEASSLEEATARLRRAIEAFRRFDGPLAPHLAFGECTKEEYEKLHAMHIADHLRAVAPPPRAFPRGTGEVR